MLINDTRLLKNLADLARIGALPGGGVSRLAFSAEDREGRDYVAAQLSNLGLESHYDAIGNLWAIRPGSGADQSVVMLGSHTDSVGAAGKYDGALGVLAALEVLTVLVENDVQTAHPVGLASFVNEEGVRFMPDMLGSMFVRGDLDAEQVRGIIGTDGSTIGVNLDQTGMAGLADMRALALNAFLEVHIEQGPILDQREWPVGTVTAVQGLKWLEVTLTGTANHAGTTPMNQRRDAGFVAGQIIGLVRETASEVPDLMGTVGRLVLKPNLINVIAQEATMTIDLRHPVQAHLEAAVARVEAAVRDLAGREGLHVDIVQTASAPAVDFDPRVVQAVRNAQSVLGLPPLEMTSGAGHDAQIIASCCPSGMIFVRSIGGVSHNPAELSRDEDMVAGANVLLLATLDLAGRVRDERS
ncbi:MAG: N-carbamoyl-L-amino-acid hydrolase [Rhodothermales bacterium]|jgi:N-carbamoyl-L-amino-acid hydrolase